MASQFLASGSQPRVQNQLSLPSVPMHPGAVNTGGQALQQLQGQQLPQQSSLPQNHPHPGPAGQQTQPRGQVQRASQAPPVATRQNNQAQAAAQPSRSGLAPIPTPDEPEIPFDFDEADRPLALKIIKSPNSKEMARTYLAFRELRNIFNTTPRLDPEFLEHMARVNTYQMQRLLGQQSDNGLALIPQKTEPIFGPEAMTPVATAAAAVATRARGNELPAFRGGLATQVHLPRNDVAAAAVQQPPQRFVANVAPVGPSSASHPVNPDVTAAAPFPGRSLANAAAPLTPSQAAPTPAPPAVVAAVASSLPAPGGYQAQSGGGSQPSGATITNVNAGAQNVNAVAQNANLPAPATVMPLVGTTNNSVASTPTVDNFNVDADLGPDPFGEDDDDDVDMEDLFGASPPPEEQPQPAEADFDEDELMDMFNAEEEQPNSHVNAEEEQLNHHVNAEGQEPNNHVNADEEQAQANNDVDPVKEEEPNDYGLFALLDVINSTEPADQTDC